jgi:hypothetical protein
MWIRIHGFDVMRPDPAKTSEYCRRPAGQTRINTGLAAGFALARERWRARWRCDASQTGLRKIQEC